MSDQNTINLDNVQIPFELTTNINHTLTYNSKLEELPNKICCGSGCFGCKIVTFEPNDILTVIEKNDYDMPYELFKIEAPDKNIFFMHTGRLQLEIKEGIFSLKK